MEIFAQAPDGSGHLIGTRCPACRRVSFPPRPVCGGCGAPGGERVPVGRRGRLQSGTVVHHAPPGFTAPYVLGLVALDEGPLVFAPLTDCRAEEAAVRPGQVVELVIAPARAGGAPVIQFRPLPPAGAAASGGEGRS